MAPRIAALAAALCLASCATLARGQTLSFYYQANTTLAPNTSPTWIGVNSGHNIDPAWTAWLKHLGANAMRIFGLAASTTLSTFNSQGGAQYGRDMSGNAIINAATFTTAVATLRTPNGRNPAQAALFTNAPRWAAYEQLQNSTSVTSGSGLSLSAQVATLKAMGVEPLLVFWLTCNMFRFSTLDPTNGTYWAEHWELYKHQYLAARWAFVRGVRKLEFWNEPDLNAPCVTTASWLEFYTLQTQAIQNAYADLNADVAAGALPCPPGSTCPVVPLIYGSAFAAASFSGPNTLSPISNNLYNGAPSPYISTYPTDGYSFMGQATVASEHLAFPPTAGVSVSTLQNMNAYSSHSYGKTGQALASLGSSVTASIASTRSLPLPAAVPVLPFSVTEHAPHTTATWNTLPTTGDTPYEASRLAAQILANAAQGFESYVFKFSSELQSVAVSPGCTGNGLTATPCGVQKTGLHWADNDVAPYMIGDTTLAGEAARMVMTAMAGGKPLESVSGVSTGFNPYTATKFPSSLIPAATVANDGRRRTLLIVNDAYNPTDSSYSTLYAPNNAAAYPATFTINVAAWGLPVGTALIHSVTGQGYVNEIATWPLTVPPSGNITVSVPAYSTSTIIAPVAPTMMTALGDVEEATIVAGANVGTNHFGAATLSVCTSATAVHDTTSVAVLKFALPVAASAVVSAVLELTVAAPPTQDMLLTVLGGNVSDPGTLGWRASSVSWSSAAFAVSQAPSAPITNLAQNFARLDNGNLVAGHISLPAASTSAGTVKRIDVTDYVRAAAAGNVTFILARRLRNPAYVGNAAGPLPADSLSGGAFVSFVSAAAGANGPVLRIYTGVAPLSLSNTIGVTVPAANVLPGRRLAAAAGEPLAEMLRQSLTAAVPSATHSVATTGYSVTTILNIVGLSTSVWNATVQRNFEDGLASDCKVRASAVQLAAMAADPNGGFDVPVSVTGFAARSGDAGMASARLCAALLAALDTNSSLVSRLARYAASRATVAVTAPVYPVLKQLFKTSSLVSLTADSDPEREATSLSNAIGGGALHNALASRGVVSHVSQAGKFSSDACPSSMSVSGPSVPPAMTTPPPKAVAPSPKKSPPPAKKPPPPGKKPAGGRRVAL